MSFDDLRRLLHVLPSLVVVVRNEDDVLSGKIGAEVRREIASAVRVCRGGESDLCQGVGVFFALDNQDFIGFQDLLQVVGNDPGAFAIVGPSLPFRSPDSKALWLKAFDLVDEGPGFIPVVIPGRDGRLPGLLIAIAIMDSKFFGNPGQHLREVAG